MMPAASTTAADRSQTLSGAAGADAHALSATVSMSRDAPPAVASASRKSSASRSSTIDACRSTYGRDVGRSAQPSREQLFAEVRARAREQLEQRGGTENIEIGRVQVILAEKSRAGLADALPSVFEARDAVLVERHCARGAIERAKDAVVPYGQCDESGNGHREQPGRDSRRRARAMPSVRTRPRRPAARS